MIDLTKKGKAFQWSPAYQKAFDDLKKILSSAEVIAYPANEGLFILDTNKSDKAVGAMLSQVQNNCERIIAFRSHALNKTERNYCITDR